MRYFCVLTLKEELIRVSICSGVGADSTGSWSQPCRPGAKGRASMSSAQRGAATRRRPAHSRCSFIVLTEHPRRPACGSSILLSFLLYLGGVTLSSPRQVRLGAGGGLVTRAGQRCHGPPVGPAPVWGQDCGTAGAGELSGPPGWGRRAVREPCQED